MDLHGFPFAFTSWQEEKGETSAFFFGTSNQEKSPKIENRS